jgi:NADPH-dependent ferric siderophore reductase
MTVVENVTVAPFRMFDVRVARVRRLSPSFLRVTFTGEDLDEFADNGYDQRMKLILPLPEVGLAPLPSGPDWYAAWRALPEELRNPVRTYTARQVRPEAREVDVDMVLHGDSGPASRFALRAQPGDIAVLLGPDARYEGRNGGLEFAPPAGYRGPLLLVGDQTAVPAVANIVEQLPRDSVGQVVLEVPHAEDRFDLVRPAGVQVTWLVRGETQQSGLVREVVRTVARPTFGNRGVEVTDEPDDVPLWDVADVDGAASDGTLYAWVAGEASVVRAVRRYLVADLGHDRRSVSFMGYWRHGRTEV